MGQEVCIKCKKNVEKTDCVSSLYIIEYEISVSEKRKAAFIIKTTPMQDPFAARYEAGARQPLAAHLAAVAQYARQCCRIASLCEAAWLAGILHDAGKYRDGVQEYLRRAAADRESVRRGEEDHSTAGGRIAEALLRKSVLSQLLQTAIYMHHGLQDCLPMDTGLPLLERRAGKELALEQIEARLSANFERGALSEAAEQARAAFEEFCGALSRLAEEEGADHAIPLSFYLGLAARTLTSLLVDADRSDAAAFAMKSALPEEEDDAAARGRWERCIERLEALLMGLPRGGALARLRGAISERCKAAAERPGRLFRFYSPTGSGKTLGALRFALEHARRNGLRQIFYIAPSIRSSSRTPIRSAKRSGTARTCSSITATY